MGILEDKKYIKKEYGLDFNEDKFYFTRPLYNYLDELLFILFLPKELNKKNLKIPYKNKLDYQKFLNSGDEKDLPEGITLESMLLVKGK